MGDQEYNFEDIKNAGKIYFVIDENRSRILYIKLKQITNKKFEELKTETNSIDLPNGLNIKNENFLKIVTQFKDQKDIAINFENEENKKDIKINNGIIYYFRDESKIKLCCKCYKKKEYDINNDANFNFNQLNIENNQNNQNNEEINIIKEKIIEDCKKTDKIPVLAIAVGEPDTVEDNKTQNTQPSTPNHVKALYFDSQDANELNELKKISNKTDKKEVKGGNKVDIFKLLEVFVIDNKDIFDPPQTVKRGQQLDLVIKEDFIFNESKEKEEKEKEEKEKEEKEKEGEKKGDPLKYKENHLLLKKSDFNDSVKKLKELKESIESIKKRITKIIFAEGFRRECYQNKSKDKNKCLNLNEIVDGLSQEIINDFISKLTKNKSDNNKYKKLIDEINNFRKEEYKTGDFGKEEKEEKEKEKKKKKEKKTFDLKQSNLDYKEILKNFGKSDYKEIFKSDYISKDDTRNTVKRNTVERDKKTKEDYLDKIYESTKNNKDVEDYVSKKMNELGINEAIKEEIQNVNPRLFGVIKENEELIIKDLIISKEEKETETKIKEEEDKGVEIKEETEYVDLTEIIFSSINEKTSLPVPSPVQPKVPSKVPPTENKKQNKFLSLLHDVYEGDEKKNKLLDLIKVSKEPQPQTKTKEPQPQTKTKSNFLKLLVEASNELKKKDSEKKDSEKINFFDIFNGSFSINDDDINNCLNKRYILYLSALDVNDIDIDIFENTNNNENNENNWNLLIENIVPLIDAEILTPTGVYKEGSMFNTACNTARIE